MSAQYRGEYTSPTVASSGCSYNTLCNYYGANPVMAPVPAGTVAGISVTPNYAAIGYDALTHGRSPSCQQYFNIQDAYGAGAGSCSTIYTTRLCGGNCGPKPSTAYASSNSGLSRISCLYISTCYLIYN